MIRAGAILAALALASCDRPASDGYQFDRREWDRVATVQFVTHPSVQHLRANAPADAMRDNGRALMAYSLIRGDRCEVHVVDPLAHYQPEWIGHEVAHCAWGRWHP